MSFPSRIHTVFHNHAVQRAEFEMKRGSRPWHMLILLSKGSFAYTLNGTEYTVKENEIAFFPANTDFERQILAPIDFHQFGFFLPSDSPFTELLLGGKLRIPHEQVRSVIRSLDQAVLYCSHDEKEIYDHLLRHILTEHALFSASQHRPPVKQDSDVAYAIQYMTEHLNEKLRLEELAGQLHVSQTTLILKFREQMHCTPSDFLIRLRMQYAKQLLTDGQKPICEIADACGYRNAYYFSNAFKKRFRMSPSEYRKRYT